MQENYSAENIWAACSVRPAGPGPGPGGGRRAQGRS